jgi:hypothetical protein
MKLMQTWWPTSGVAARNGREPARFVATAHPDSVILALCLDKMHVPSVLPHPRGVADAGKPWLA